MSAPLIVDRLLLEWSFISVHFNCCRAECPTAIEKMDQGTGFHLADAV